MIIKEIGPTKILVISLILIIIIGTIILKLPICNQQPIKTMDTIFVATSATCVTGLSTVTLVDTFTIFGQFVIMCLIQIGGLGFMLIIALLLMMLGKKITLKNRMLISQSLNTNSLEGLVRLTRKVLKYTFTFEIIGALFIAIDFVPIYGFRMRIV